MAKRLVESYLVGDPVELLLVVDEVEAWRPGRVAGLQHPGVWVLTSDEGRLWFVTNGKRIRPQVSPAPHPAAS